MWDDGSGSDATLANTFNVNASGGIYLNNDIHANSHMYLSGLLDVDDDITLNNGADINMNGSPGSTIIFPDGTIQSTATVAGPQGGHRCRWCAR